MSHKLGLKRSECSNRYKKHFLESTNFLKKTNAKISVRLENHEMDKLVEMGRLNGDMLFFSNNNKLNKANVLNKQTKQKEQTQVMPPRRIKTSVNSYKGHSR
jgi:hypothetical protein